MSVFHKEQLEQLEHTQHREVIVSTVSHDEIDIINKQASKSSIKWKLIFGIFALIGLALFVYFMVRHKTSNRNNNGKANLQSRQYLEIKATLPDDPDDPIVDTIVEIKTLDLTIPQRPLHLAFFVMEINEAEYFNIESKFCYLDVSHDIKEFDTQYLFRSRVGDDLANDGPQMKMDVEQNGNYTCRKYSSKIPVRKIHAVLLEGGCDISMTVHGTETFVLNMNFISVPKSNMAIGTIPNQMWTDMFTTFMIGMRGKNKTVQIDRESLHESSIINALKDSSIIYDFPAYPGKVTYLNEIGWDWGALTQNFIDTIMQRLPNLITDDDGIIKRHIDEETQILFAKVIVICVYMDNGLMGLMYTLNCDIYQKTLNKLYFKLALPPTDIIASSISAAMVLEDIQYLDVFDEHTKDFMDDTNYCQLIDSSILEKHGRLLRLIENQNWALNIIPQNSEQIYHWQHECKQAVTRYVYNTKFKTFSTILNQVLVDTGVVYFDRYSRTAFADAIYSKSDNVDVEKLKAVVSDGNNWVCIINNKNPPKDWYYYDLKNEYKSWLLKWVEENKDNKEKLKGFLEFWTGSENKIMQKPMMFRINMDLGRLPEAHQCTFDIDFYGYPTYTEFNYKLNMAIEESGGYHIE